MSAHGTPLRTHKQARQWLISNGLTVREWAKKNGFNSLIVYDVLRGKTKGKFGQAHHIAIALGIKEPPESGLKQVA